MVPMERCNLQSPVIHVTTAKRIRGQSSVKYISKMYDTIHAANGESRTKDRYFHCRLANELASTRKNTEPSTNKEVPNEIRLSLSIQHRIGLRTYERNLWTSANLQETTLHSPPNKYIICGWISELRVQKLWPNIDWARIWKNLNDAPVPEKTRCNGIKSYMT